MEMLVLQSQSDKYYTHSGVLKVSFESHGYIHLPLRLSDDRLSEIRRALAVYQTRKIQSDYGILRNNAYLEISILRQTIEDYSLGQMACEMLDIDEVVLFQDNLIWKPAHTGQTIEWHQDYSYWPLSAPKGITFWIALDDTNRDNGCMRYLPQSHQWGECQPANFFKQDGYFEHSDLPTLTLCPDDGVDIELQAGQAVAHHPLLAHMSHPNNSTRERRGWSLTWVDASVTWDPDHAPHPYPVFHNVQKGARIEGDDFPRYRR
jgi:hypothetical protein